MAGATIGWWRWAGGYKKQIQLDANRQSFTAVAHWMLACEQSKAKTRGCRREVKRGDVERGLSGHSELRNGASYTKPFAGSHGGRASQSSAVEPSAIAQSRSMGGGHDALSLWLSSWLRCPLCAHLCPRRLTPLKGPRTRRRTRRRTRTRWPGRREGGVEGWRGRGETPRSRPVMHYQRPLRVGGGGQAVQGHSPDSVSTAVASSP